MNTYTAKLEAQIEALNIKVGDLKESVNYFKKDRDRWVERYIKKEIEEEKEIRK